MSMRTTHPGGFSDWAECAGAAAVATALALALTGVFNQAAIISLIRDTAESRGLDPDDFVRMAEIESGFDPFAVHPVSRASGLFQFLPATARQYKLTSVFDARANADAAAALWIDNARALRKGLGRDPSPGELYLAHQQGAGGALRLLTHPNTRATDIVGEAAVTLNGGTDLMTADAFADMWISRFRQD